MKKLKKGDNMTRRGIVVAGVVWLGKISRKQFEHEMKIMDGMDDDGEEDEEGEEEESSTNEDAKEVVGGGGGALVTKKRIRKDVMMNA